MSSLPVKHVTDFGLGGEEERFVCPCFYTEHFFIKEIGRHVSFGGRASFEASQDGKEISELLSGGQYPELIMDKILSALEKEQTRRKNLLSESRKRQEHVYSHYSPLHPQVYSLQPRWLDPEFLCAVEAAKSIVAEASEAPADAAGEEGRGSAGTGTAVQKQKLLSAVASAKARLKEQPRGVFVLPVFSLEFCKLLTEELIHFMDSEMPKGRPNSMNNYGVLLQEMGLYPHLLTPLLHEHMAPLAAVLFPDHGGGSLDHHRSFVVKYREGEDVELAYHYDDAEVTLNVNLGVDFEGGELLFGGLKSAADNGSRHAVEHEVGMGVLHLGQKMHEALPIDSGLRLNLIMWCRSSHFRYQACPNCGKKSSSAAL